MIKTNMKVDRAHDQADLKRAGCTSCRECAQAKLLGDLELRAKPRLFRGFSYTVRCAQLLRGKSGWLRTRCRCEGSHLPQDTTDPGYVRGQALRIHRC